VRSTDRQDAKQYSLPMDWKNVLPPSSGISFRILA
jgi:hypothetical protein